MVVILALSHAAAQLLSLLALLTGKDSWGEKPQKQASEDLQCYLKSAPTNFTHPIRAFPCFLSIPLCPKAEPETASFQCFIKCNVVGGGWQKVE